MNYKLTIHAGHGPYPGKSVGAIGYLNESVEARNVVNELKKLVKCMDVTVTDPTLSANQILRVLTERMNECDRTLNLSIHLNAYELQSANGCECWTYGENGICNKVAADIRDSICEELGIKKRENRIGKNLYVLKNTDSPTILIECCFVTSLTDAQKWDAKACAKAIYKALANNFDNIDCASDKKDEVENDTITSSGKVVENSSYKVQVGAFKYYDNAKKLAEEIKKAGFECFIKKE